MKDNVTAQLRSIRGLKVECPTCRTEFPIRRATLVGMHDKYPVSVQTILRERFEGAKNLQDDFAGRRKELAEAKKRKPRQIEVAARATLFGQISEQILPAFRTFPYKRSECRILLKPIDYVVFGGLSRERRVSTITFVDVKTGNGRLTPGQRQIRDCVQAGKIAHTVIR